MTPSIVRPFSRSSRDLLDSSGRVVAQLDAALNEDWTMAMSRFCASKSADATMRGAGRVRIQTHEYPDRVMAWCIAQKVIAARRRKGWTQEDLAKATGIARPNVARLEKGRSIPRIPTLRRVAHALDLQLESLLKGPSLTKELEDLELAESGLGEWAGQLDREDRP